MYGETERDILSTTVTDVTLHLRVEVFPPVWYVQRPIPGLQDSALCARLSASAGRCDTYMAHSAHNATERPPKGALCVAWFVSAERYQRLSNQVLMASNMIDSSGSVTSWPALTASHTLALASTTFHMATSNVGLPFS